MRETLPYTDAFAGVLGGGVIVQSDWPVGAALHRRLRTVIEHVERMLSRFRADSTVARIARHGGSFAFPDWAEPLFAWYDELFAATDGRIDPGVGADLIHLGYAMSFDMLDAEAHGGLCDFAGHSPSMGRARWCVDVRRRGAVLVTDRPMQLDFGACGKGLCVDLLAAQLESAFGEEAAFVIDAGGDLCIRNLPHPMRIALEHPSDVSRAIGIAELANGSFCASAPSRRHWHDLAGRRVHHLLDAVTGAPVDDVAASWVAVPTSGANSLLARFPACPTMLADGLATALFCTPPADLDRGLAADRGAGNAFDYAVVDSAGRLQCSPRFPATFFV